MKIIPFKFLLDSHRVNNVKNKEGCLEILETSFFVVRSQGFEPWTH